MGKVNYTTEQIIVKLREAEVHCSQGKTIGEAVRQIGVTEQTCYRWRKKYGGMSTIEARKYKELEKENARLKRLVADLSLDNGVNEKKEKIICLQFKQKSKNKSCS